MANHVVADQDLGPVEQYRDLSRYFGEQNWIDAALEETWTRITGFRNILAHDYLEVDRRIVYEVLPNNLADLPCLRSVFARFL